MNEGIPAQGLQALTDGPIASTDIGWQLAPLDGTEHYGDLAELFLDVIIEGESYRLLAQQAIHQLHQAGVEHNRLQGRYNCLLLEYRQLRETSPRRELVTS